MPLLLPDLLIVVCPITSLADSLRCLCGILFYEDGSGLYKRTDRQGRQ